NGFVTMFFLAIPVVSSAISMLLSRWISDLRIIEGPLFLLGLVLVTLPLLVFSMKTWRGADSIDNDVTATSAPSYFPAQNS
ncbi:hypothetical protein, partial [Roseiarcus sp.]|uniref:hypothetical protein n=1 Tax=Roseiarcus sp. TaxID=1969460 RepID=UPI003F97A634